MTVRGTTSFVICGVEADVVLVPASTEDGVAVLAVEGSAPGLVRRSLVTLDLTRGMAELDFQGTPATLIGVAGVAAVMVGAGRDLALTALAAEQVGVAQQALDVAVEWVKQRVQFERAIGSFQAIKHQLVDLLLQVELARSAMEEAAHCADTYLVQRDPRSRDALRLAASAAKAMCSEAAVNVSRQSLHLFGGIGFTWEHDAHLYYRRALADGLLLGDAAQHRARLSAAMGVRRVSLLEVARVEGVVTVALARPERKNGITGLLVEELIAVLQGIEADPKDRAVVLTGAGGAFCSGMDLSEPVVPDELTFMNRVGTLCRLLFELPRPTLAKVRGPAIGFGANLALCCDLVLASEDAGFGEVFAARGLAMDGGGSWSLPRRVGLTKAKEIAFFGETLDGTEAARIGLVNRAVPDAELDELVAEWAQRLARAPRRSLSLLKSGLNTSYERSFAEALDAETLAQALSFRSPEAKEGVQAFRERRDPDFRHLL